MKLNRTIIVSLTYYIIKTFYRIYFYYKTFFLKKKRLLRDVSTPNTIEQKILLNTETGSPILQKNINTGFHEP